MKFLIFLSLFSTVSISQSQSLKITYLGNEGVLLEGKNQKVMIDELFDNYYKDYLSPEESTIKNMMDRKAPFDNLQVLLCTHVHRDHFEAQIAGKFLSSHFSPSASKSSFLRPI